MQIENLPEEGVVFHIPTTEHNSTKFHTAPTLCIPAAPPHKIQHILSIYQGPSLMLE
jgi:hypothetical protein